MESGHSLDVIISNESGLISVQFHTKEASPCPFSFVQELRNNMLAKEQKSNIFLISMASNLIRCELYNKGELFADFMQTVLSSYD